MADLLAEPLGGAPITEDERQALRLPVLTRDELNRVEAENIGNAMLWLFNSRRRLRPESVVRQTWLIGLHRRMYDQVWRRAGTVQDHREEPRRPLLAGARAGALRIGG
jgi:fido (protein-threonine AMPylation protein)